MKKKKLFSIPVALIILFFVSFFLRYYLLWENLFFGPEQGIDFMVIKDIAINHKLTLIGAKTDVAGIFHGPIYYYLSVFPFLISGGNPLVILGFLILLNCFTVFLIYLLGKELFNKRVGLISAVLFSVSYGSIEYSRWLSSHPLAIPLSCIFFLSLNRFLHGNKKSLIITSIAYGLLGQTEILNFLFFGVILFLIIIIFKKEFRKLKFSYALGYILLLILFSLGNYFLFDIRHNFIISKSIYKLMVGSTGYYVNLYDSLINGLKTYNLSFLSFVIPSYPTISIIFYLLGLGVLTRLIFKNNKNACLILLWLIMPLLLLVLLRHDFLQQFFVAISAASILTVAVFVDSLWRKTALIGFVCMIILIAINMNAWRTNIVLNNSVFFQSTQPYLKFSDQIKVIDRIYKKVNGQPFSFQAYTIPYWMQEGWEYLFWHYGAQKYGYGPIEVNAKTLFVIIQDDPSYPSFQKYWLKDTVSKWGKVKNTFRYGFLSVRELGVQ